MEEKVVDQTKRDYPYVGYNTESGSVILFTGANTGYWLMGNAEWPCVGKKVGGWKEEVFAPHLNIVKPYLKDGSYGEYLRKYFDVEIKGE